MHSDSAPIALRVTGVNKRFGGLHVTRDISFNLREGDRMALIGPNGAGKTTLVNLLSGVLNGSTGTVHLFEQDITLWDTAQRVRAGLTRTFQITMLVAHLPILHQVQMAIFEREHLAWSVWRGFHQYPGVVAEAMELLERFGLGRQAACTPSLLAYGEQRIVEIVLALALKPRVLLLDEPMAGVPRAESERLVRALDELPSELAVLIIEHDMDLVFRWAKDILVLAEGAVLAQGGSEAIRNDARVRAAYLGN